MADKAQKVILDTRMSIRARLDATPGLIARLRDWKAAAPTIWKNRAKREVKIQKVDNILKQIVLLEDDLERFIKNDLEPSEADRREET